jgi:hypothetical protein
MRMYALNYAYFYSMLNKINFYLRVAILKGVENVRSLYICTFRCTAASVI